MRVVEGLERQKSTRDMLAGAGGEPASRPIPPVLGSGDSFRRTRRERAGGGGRGGWGVKNIFTYEGWNQRPVNKHGHKVCVHT